jgi:Ca2+-binding EF-hand superfamily protein
LDQGTIDERVELGFAVYDCDGNGDIEPYELEEVLSTALKDMGGAEFAPQQMKNRIDATFRKFDTNHDDKMSLEEFRQGAYENLRILGFVSANLERLLSQSS